MKTGNLRILTGTAGLIKNMNSGGDRFIKLDNVKAVLVFCVVLGHIIGYNTEDEAPFYQALFLFIYSFHMPLFIFISGYFHKNKDIKNKIIYYLILGGMLRIVVFAVNNLVLKNPGSLSFLTTDGCAWFLFAAAAYTALEYLLRNYSPLLVFVLALILACFAGYDTDIDDFLVLSRIIVFFPFYHAGCCAKKDNVFRNFLKPEKRLLKCSRAFLSAAALCAWAAICVFCLDSVYELRPFFTGRHPFGGLYSDSFSGFLTRFLCYAISFMAGTALLYLVPDKKIPFLTKIGERSLSVYFWHRPVIYILDSLGVTDLCFGSELSLLWCTAAALIITAVFGFHVFYRPFEWLKRQIFKL